ncbi:MAG: DNA replication/repair protein RecF [Tissierellia bacterium]|nr:DNA replication/repair protein RecF [Tissierellia bacterium]
MKIKDIQLLHFRNYENIYFTPNEKINIFLGKNAQGKTNLLEGMGYLVSGKSFRTNSDKEVISFDEDQSYIRALLEIYGYDHLYELKISKMEKKRLRIDGEEVQRLKEFKREGAAVIFGPVDMNMIKFSPQNRRKYLDDVIIQLDEWYEKNLNNYGKILEQRNQLLRKAKYRNLTNLLDIYNLQLAELATEIISTRLETMKILNMSAKNIYRHLASYEEELSTRYLSTLPYHKEKKEMIHAIYKKYHESSELDLEKGRTTLGPHRDDIQFLINGHDGKLYGSQGQQRSIILAMKLAEVEYIKDKKGFYPILLLDDVFSELDRERKRFLTESIVGCQCFITMTDSIDLRELKDRENNLYKIENNKIIGANVL